MGKTINRITIIVASGILTGLLFALTQKRINPKGKKAVFVGDSHTSLYGTGWQNTLGKLYGFEVDNISKVGTQTDWMYSQLKTYLSKNKPDMIFIYGGANDIWAGKSAKSVWDNTQKMVDIGIQNGIPSKNIFVVSGYRTADVVKGSKYDTKNFIKRMDATKEGLKSQVKRATIVPIWEDGTTKDTGDGLHITKSAQDRFGKFVGSKIFK